MEIVCFCVQFHQENELYIIKCCTLVPNNLLYPNKIEWFCNFDLIRKRKSSSRTVFILHFNKICIFFIFEFTHLLNFNSARIYNHSEENYNILECRKDVDKVGGEGWLFIQS